MIFKLPVQAEMDFLQFSSSFLLLRADVRAVLLGLSVVFVPKALVVFIRLIESRSNIICGSFTYLGQGGNTPPSSLFCPVTL